MSRQYRIVYSEESMDDLREIRDYIQDVLFSPEAARGQVARIRKSIEALRSMPNRHVTLDWEPWLSEGVRGMVVDNYLVLYAVDDVGLEITIARVLYGARDLNRIASQTD